MNKRQWRSLVIGALAFGASGVALVWGWGRWFPAPASSQSEVAALTASGVIQAQQVTVASELGGVILEINAIEGQAVAAGAPVVQLDPALIDGEIAVAEARLASAEAGLMQARAGARSGQIAVAEAQLLQAKAGHKVASRAVSDTQMLVDRPQEIDLQIAVLRGRLESARAEQARATALKDVIEVIKGPVDEAWATFDGGGRKRFLVASGDITEDLKAQLPPELRELLPDDLDEGLGNHVLVYGDYELHLRDGIYELYVWRVIDFPLAAQMLPNQWWQAWVGVNAATAQVEGLEASLRHLYAERDAPQALAAQVNEARAVEAEMAQQVLLAQVQVEALREGLTPQEVAVIEAQVGVARAAFDATIQKRELLTLAAPITGTIVEVLAQEGEVAAQGAPLLIIADLRDLTLTVYVPEGRLGDVWLEQPVEARVGSFPGRVFHGRVSYIAGQAEFTPRNVATEEERESLVFAVYIRLDNAGGALKPGMPADVVFLTGATED